MKLTFFPVSTGKFVILSIVTFSIYPVFWFYQNWKRIGHATRSERRIGPLLRTTLAPLWATRLLRIIKERAEADAIAVTWSPLALGIAFIILSLSAFLPKPWWLISIGLFAPLLPPLQTCQRVNAAAGNPEGLNDAYSAGNVATIIIGALFWVLVGYAMTIQIS